nr:MAG TPA: hypothetical protein [Caudoviricetes sp.]
MDRLSTVGTAQCGEIRYAERVCRTRYGRTHALRVQTPQGSGREGARSN